MGAKAWAEDTDTLQYYWVELVCKFGWRTVCQFHSLQHSLHMVVMWVCKFAKTHIVYCILHVYGLPEWSRSL